MHLKSLRFVRNEFSSPDSDNVTYVVLGVDLRLDEVLAGKGNFLSMN